MSVTDLPFGTQLIGQTEKSLNAILGKLLSGSGVTESQWVALNIALAAGDGVRFDDLVDRVTGAIHVGRADAQALLADLGERGFVEVADWQVSVTAAGRAFQRDIRSSVDVLTGRLWGEIPEADRRVAGRVLDTVLANARAELATL